MRSREPNRESAQAPRGTGARRTLCLPDGHLLYRCCTVVWFACGPRLRVRLRHIFTHCAIRMRSLNFILYLQYTVFRWTSITRLRMRTDVLNYLLQVSYEPNPCAITCEKVKSHSPRTRHSSTGGHHAAAAPEQFRIDGSTGSASQPTPGLIESSTTAHAIEATALLSLQLFVVSDQLACGSPGKFHVHRTLPCIGSTTLLPPANRERLKWGARIDWLKPFYCMRCSKVPSTIHCIFLPPRLTFQRSLWKWLFLLVVNKHKVFNTILMIWIK
jgi:hypothetical protein